MDLSIKNLKALVFLEKYQTLENTKKLGNIVGISNILTCLIFYGWLIFHVNSTAGTTSTNLIVTAIVFHVYITSIFISWSLPYEGAKWTIWGWTSLIFALPFGIGLIVVCSNDKYWENTEIKEKKGSLFHSLTNSFVNISDQITSAINYLQNTYPSEAQELFESLHLKVDDCDSWSNKAKFLMIALHEALRQTKKTNTFNDVVFHAHWYDQRRFDFAIRDPKSLIMPVRYKFSLAFIVLDEFNNYQKILDGKKEIKRHMKFGTAKTICLHWGKGFKVYVNE